MVLLRPDAGGSLGRATMRDVAALAGVSQKTVSRVVNDEAGVSEDLVRRVQKAAQQLGYRHNLAASNLRAGRRSGSVALLVQDLSNDYSAALLRAVDDLAREQGLVVLSASLDEEEAREREIVANLIARRVDGMILMPATSTQAYLQPDVAAGFAVVMIDRVPAQVATDYVVVDNVRGAREATEHLLRGGHRRIALITDDLSIATARERRDGYLAALEAAGLPMDEALMHSARTVEASREVADGLLELAEPPTAVFAGRNTATVGTAVALRARALQHEVALVGFDEIRLADLVDPGITTVDQEPAEVGRRAAALLLARLDGTAGLPQGIVLPTRLHPRGSGEIPGPG